jgi:hypothetical protein
LSNRTDPTSFDVGSGVPNIHSAHAFALNQFVAKLQGSDVRPDVLIIRAITGDDDARHALLKWLHDFVSNRSEIENFEVDSQIDRVLNALESAADIDADLLFRIVDMSASNAGRSAVDRLVRSGNEEIFHKLLDLYNAKEPNFAREALFAGLETMARRYGRRIARDNMKLVVEDS